MTECYLVGLECNTFIIFFPFFFFLILLYLPLVCYLLRMKKKIGQDLVLMFLVFLLDGGLRLNFAFPINPEELSNKK